MIAIVGYRHTQHVGSGAHPVELELTMDADGRYVAALLMEYFDQVFLQWGVPMATQLLQPTFQMRNNLHKFNARGRVQWMDTGNATMSVRFNAAPMGYNPMLTQGLERLFSVPFRQPGRPDLAGDLQPIWLASLRSLPVQYFRDQRTIKEATEAAFRARPAFRDRPVDAEWEYAFTHAVQAALEPVLEAGWQESDLYCLVPPSTRRHIDHDLEAEAAERTSQIRGLTADRIIFDDWEGDGDDSFIGFLEDAFDDEEPAQAAEEEPYTPPPDPEDLSPTIARPSAASIPEYTPSPNRRMHYDPETREVTYGPD